MSNEKELDIQYGVLKHYIGEGIDVVIPDEVIKIGENAFYGCDTVTSITIPDSVTRIWKWTFYECENLTLHASKDNRAVSYCARTDKDGDYVPIVVE